MPRPLELHATSQQGRRPSNEDVERFRLNLGNDGRAIDSNYAPVDFFVICDGHGGREVAEIVAPALMKQMTRSHLTYPLSYNTIKKIYDHIQNIIINHPDGIGEECGCTALVLIRYFDSGKEYIQVLNLGDCRAVICRRGIAIPLTKDHKPSWPDEKIRINNVNRKMGTDDQIVYEEHDWRIHGLSVSRAFGDLSATPHVSHIPESFIYDLQRDDEFIILACDGLWDVLENHCAVNFVRDHNNNNQIDFYDIPKRYPTQRVRDSNNISRKLASYAIAKDSWDNVSVLIAIFR